MQIFLLVAHEKRFLTLLVQLAAYCPRLRPSRYMYVYHGFLRMYANVCMTSGRTRREEETTAGFRGGGVSGSSRESRLSAVFRPQTNNGANHAAPTQPQHRKE